jgi:signal transduction histidine kinase
LAAALAVPLALLAAFAAMQVRGAYNAADRIKHQTQVAKSATGPAGVVNVLVNERNYQSLRVIGLEQLVEAKKTTAAQTTGRTNLAVGMFRSQLQNLGKAAAANYAAALQGVSSTIEPIRGEAEKLASGTSLANAKDASALFDSYSKLIDKFLDADQSAALQIDDAKLRNGAELLNTISRQNDVESRILIKTALTSVAHDPAGVRAVQQLAGLQSHLEDQLRLRSADTYASAIASALGSSDRRGAIAALQAAANDPTHVDVGKLFAQVPASARIGLVLSNVAGVVQDRAAKLSADAQTREMQYLAIAIGSLLLAIALLRLTNRWITQPLRALADQAVSVASERLPAAVKQILATPVTDEVVRPDLVPVHVRAGGEVREVEDALNRVQESAVDLAVEQAQLRRNVADAYVNLGRRNQNLLSRQLEFITQLENDESDPDTLEHLFRLDHLATRMRRNAESLLVLAGHEAPRTWSAPVEIGDVVRGALGEVEGYQRARLRHLDAALVDGGVAADVSHVVAELVENALSFSPPDSDVEIYGRRDDFGYLLTILDSGLGMAPDDLEFANALFSGVETHAVAASRYLGHYVVAQLAVRHGLGVHLAASPGGGITATVALPSVLVGGAAPDGSSETEPAPPLPRRVALVPEPDVEPQPEPAPQPVPAAVDPEPVSGPSAIPVRDDDAAAAMSAFALLAGAGAAEAPAEPEPAPLALVAAPEPGAESETAVEAVLVDEPELDATPARPRLGLGTFADLRSTPAHPPVAKAPEAEPPALDHPELDAVPNRQESYAAVAEAVGAATGRSGVDPADVPDFSEDLLPKKLPKRGRRASRLQTPWTRERPAKHADASAALSALSVPAAATEPVPTTFDPAAAHLAPPAPPSGAPGALRFGPGSGGGDAPPEGAPPAQQEVTGPADPPDQHHAPEGGDDRFAFFAAFRAAAERAREEAGIDDRRVGR